MRNKITIDMEKESGYDCECIISEGDGKNTLELYMWNVGSNPSIEISWVKGGGSGDESRYDVNGDGEITQEDADEILNYWATNGGYEYKYDIDLDGYVTPKDAYLVENKAAGIVDPEEGGSAVVEGIFLDNDDYYYSIPFEYISGYRTVTVKVKWSGFESKAIYFNCININENTDFIVTRNLSRDDTYTVIAATEETLQIATKDILGIVRIGDGIDVDEKGVISTPRASKDIFGTVKIGDGLAIDENGVLFSTAEQLTPINDYKYISDTSVRFNGITYNVEKDSATGLISRITDNYNHEFSPTINSGITDVALHNAVFWASAMISGFSQILKRILYDGTNGSWTFSNGFSGFTKVTNIGQPASGADNIAYTSGMKVIRLSKAYRLTDYDDNYTDTIVLRSNEQINLTGFKTLRVLAVAFKNHSALTGYVYFKSGEASGAVRQEQYDFSGWTNVASCDIITTDYNAPGTAQWYDIDISAVNGNQYLNFAVYHGPQISAYTTYFDVQQMVLIP